jgi:hypothetical protein
MAAKGRRARSTGYREERSQHVCVLSTLSYHNPFGPEVRVMPDGAFYLVGNAGEVADALGRDSCEGSRWSSVVVPISTREAFDLLSREGDEETLSRYAYALSCM